MGYTPDNLSLVSGNIGGRGRRRFDYWTDDTLATIVGAGYISDATKKGMRVGDIVEVFYGTLITVGPDQSPATVAGGTTSEFAAQPTSVELFYCKSISAGAATIASTKIVIGSEASSTVGFFGTTPTSQKASATLSSTLSLFALTGASFVADSSCTVSGLFGFNSTLAKQLFDALQEMRTYAAALGLHKGGA